MGGKETVRLIQMDALAPSSRTLMVSKCRVGTVVDWVFQACSSRSARMVRKVIFQASAAERRHKAQTSETRRSPVFKSAVLSRCQPRRSHSPALHGPVKNPFKKILCPVDFDENSMAALQVARDLAVDPDAQLYVVHVVRLVMGGFPKELHSYPLTEQAARLKLQDIARQHLEGKVRYETFVRTGDPASVILRMVEELGVDSVIMATHGRTGLGHFLLGSVAEKVVRESPRPVLTIREPA